MEKTLGDTLRGLNGPVLITGHSGFKGTWLTLMLERLGIQVIGVSLEAEKNSLYSRCNRKDRIPELITDLANYNLVSEFFNKYKPSAVFHMAAQPLVLESYKTPRKTFETNVMGTVNILDICLQFESVKSVAIITTDKVYKNSNSNNNFVETDPLEGKDPYSSSKVAAEASAIAWQQLSNLNSGPEIFTLRAGNVIGGGDWSENRLIPDLIRALIENENLNVRNPNSTRPWQHVLDPLYGYILACESSLQGVKIKSINFGPLGSSLSVTKVLNIAMNSWDKQSETKIQIVDNDEALEAKTLSLDSNLASKILNWSPNWSQESAVVDTMKWWDKVINKSVSPFQACMYDIEKIIE